MEVLTQEKVSNSLGIGFSSVVPLFCISDVCRRFQASLENQRGCFKTSFPVFSTAFLPFRKDQWDITLGKRFRPPVSLFWNVT